MKGVHIEHKITTGKCFIDPHNLFFSKYRKIYMGKEQVQFQIKITHPI